MITTKQLEELGFKRYAHSKNGVKCYYYALFTYDFPELNNIQLRTKSIEDKNNNEWSVHSGQIKDLEFTDIKELKTFIQVVKNNMKIIKITRNSFGNKVIDKMLLNNSKISDKDINEDELYMIEYVIYQYNKRKHKINYLVPVSKRLCLDFVSFNDKNEIYLINNHWTSWQL